MYNILNETLYKHLTSFPSFDNNNVRKKIGGWKMNSFAKPVVVMSKCLGFEACRYNGAIIQDPVVKKIAMHVQVVTVCPEVEIGLDIPRTALRIVMDQGNRLVQPSTKRDYTEEMKHFTVNFLESLGEVDGFILKSRSPSCAIKDAKVYAGWEQSPVIEKSAGLFGDEIIKRFDNLAVEDEGRLTNRDIRERFLIKLFTLAAFRSIKSTGLIRNLVEFQSKNKYLFMALHQKKQKELGYIVANHEKKQIHEVYAQYEHTLQELLAKPASRRSIINVLLHIMGYFSKQLGAKEKSYFLNMTEKYKHHQVPLSNLLVILRSWAIRFDEEYLLYQTLFEPYPEQLDEMMDSGKGRVLTNS